MSTDLDLLKLATQAAGMTVAGLADKMLVDPEHWAGGLIVVTPTGGHKAWNPLTDDGDALRLAVKLRIDVMWPRPHDHVCAARLMTQAAGMCEDLGGDDMAATRRAIVRAAAELGHG